MAFRVGLIGGGSMGTLHARVISQSQGATLRWVIDPDADTRGRLESRYQIPSAPGPDLTAIDALVVASPTATHLEWCMLAIEAGVPFLVEKPLAPSLTEAEIIVEAALAAGVPFTVGFVERFNPAIRTLDGIIDEPIYFSAVRHSPYVPRVKTGVASDLLIHDMDLAIRILGGTPSVVEASYLRVHPSSDEAAEDVADAHLRFSGGQKLASLSASRVAQRKIRSVTVSGIDRSAELDLIRQDITIYRHVLNSPLSEDGPGYRQETIMEIPELVRRDEPLAAQFVHFVDLAAGALDPVAEASSVLEPHRVLAAADASARTGSPSAQRVS